MPTRQPLEQPYCCHNSCTNLLPRSASGECRFVAQLSVWMLMSTITTHRIYITKKYSAVTEHTHIAVTNGSCCSDLEQTRWVDLARRTEAQWYRIGLLPKSLFTSTSYDAVKVGSWCFLCNSLTLELTDMNGGTSSRLIKTASRCRWL